MATGTATLAISITAVAANSFPIDLLLAVGLLVELLRSTISHHWYRL